MRTKHPSSFLAQVVLAGQCRLSPWTLLLIIISSLFPLHEAASSLPQFQLEYVDSSSIEWNNSFGWENSYYSEGRDNLSGASFTVASVDFVSDLLSGGACYGYSEEAECKELQLFVEVSKTMNDLEYGIGSTYLKVPGTNEDDYEIGAFLAWSGLPGGIQIEADVYYSMNSEGSFIEARLVKDFEVGETWVFSLSTVLGSNQGYVSDGHDGLNHIALEWEFTLSLSDSLKVFGSGAYSSALNRSDECAGDQTLSNLSHYGFGFSWFF